MQIQQLRAFVAVARHRHFTRAADDVGITQPSLSKQIHALEADLDAALFTRTRGDIALTAAGDALLPLAIRILADVDTARREVEDLAGLRRGRVRLGATPSLCTSLVAEVLRRYHDRFPGVELQVMESGSQDLVRALTHGELDLALVILPEQGIDESLLAAPILTESLVVASAEPLPITAADGQLHVTDLRDRPMVMFRPGYDLRDATLEACSRAGFTPPFAVEGGEMDAVLGFVEAGLGVALVPGLVLSTRPRLLATPLAPPGVRRTIALAHRREHTLAHAAQELQTTLLDYLAEADADDTLPSGVERVGRSDAIPSADGSYRQDE